MLAIKIKTSTYKLNSVTFNWILSDFKFLKEKKPGQEDAEVRY